MRRALGAVVIVALAAAVAQAAPRVAVVGDDAAAVAAVRAALDGDVELVTAAGATAAEVLADDPQLAAVVLVTVRGRGTRSVTVVAYQGADGREVGRVAVRARGSKLARAVESKARSLVPVVLAARPREVAPPPSTPTPDAVPAATVPVAEPPRDETPRVDDRPAPRRAARTWPRVQLAIEQRPFVRRLRYNDDLRKVTRAYDLAADAMGGELVVRPVPSLPRLAVGARGELAIAVNGSRTSDGTEYATRAWEWAGFVGWGLRAGRLSLAIDAGVGEQRFAIDDDSAMGAELVPDARYRYARLGVDGAWRLDRRWSLVGGAGGRYLLGTGDLAGADFFPRATGRGVDGALGAAYHVGRFAFTAQLEVRHYFFAMNPEVGDPMIVGGAVDTYVGASLGAAVAVP